VRQRGLTTPLPRSWWRRVGRRPSLFELRSVSRQRKGQWRATPWGWPQAFASQSAKEAGPEGPPRTEKGEAGGRHQERHTKVECPEAQN